MALRPRSFPIAAGPVLVGAAFAGLKAETLPAGIAALALAASLLMQAITNLQNDVGFTSRAGEAGRDAVGLPRATALGLLSPTQVRAAIACLSLLALALGLCLAYLRGAPVLLLGGASLLAALAYMGGPRPIAYTPWGEFTVLLFFGWVAVGGSHWLLDGTVPCAAWLAATACGALSAAALALNNLRDREHDARLGRRTFAVVWGVQAAQRMFGLCLATPLLIAASLAWLLQAPTLLLPWLLAPRLWALRRDLHACPGGAAFNPLLLRTFALVQAHALLLALGAFLAWN